MEPNAWKFTCNPASSEGKRDAERADPSTCPASLWHAKKGVRLVPDAPRPDLSSKRLDALEDRGYAHATADAQRHQAVLATGAGEVVQYLGGQDGARCPYRVSQGYRSAHRVHLFLGHLERTLHRDGDGGEGLVGLDGIEVVDRETSLLEGEPGGGDHTSPHHRRIHAGHGGGDEPARHGQAQLLGL